MSAKKLIVVVGPTASGKTDLAIDLAKHYKTVILSADSRQFYKEISIGTAKPNHEQLAAVQHYFIDSHSIREEINAGQYEIQAINLLSGLFKSHDTIIMAGGSGLYIDAVCKGFDPLPQADEALRDKYDNILQESGIKFLQDLLKEKDPVYHSKVDLQNPHRIIRALEVCEITGLPYSSFRKAEIKKREFEIIKLGIDLPRELLYKRIDERVLTMMQNGLLDEVRSVMQLKYLNALNTVGYKELFDHLEGKTTLEEAVSLIQRNTRRFAKRQMTWFRKDPQIKWIKDTALQPILTKV